MEATIATIIAAAAPLLFVTAGETISEKSGVINLSLEGSLMLSALAGFAVAFETGDDLARLRRGSRRGSRLRLRGRLLEHLAVAQPGRRRLRARQPGHRPQLVPGQPLHRGKPGRRHRGPAHSRSRCCPRSRSSDRSVQSRPRGLRQPRPGARWCGSTCIGHARAVAPGQSANDPRPPMPAASR